MLIPILFFPALLVCNDAFPDEVVEDPPDDPPVTTAGTTVTAVTVEREPLGKVVVKTRVDVLLLVVTVAFVGVSSAGEAVDSAMLVDLDVTTTIEVEPVTVVLAELANVDKTSEPETSAEKLEAPAKVVAPEAVA